MNANKTEIFNQLNKPQRQILITAALPYANSPIHIGHLLEHFQVDFWCRYQNLIGNQCSFVCADDTHGTPIMIAAQNAGITPEAHIQKIWESHVNDFKDFKIHHHHYSSTNSVANKQLCEYFYEELKKSNHFTQKLIEQLYCEHDRMFLPDRYVKGTCPKCKATDQYGDNCDKCGATYATTELIEPKCSLCGTKPVLKESEHVLFQLNHFKTFLETWIPSHTQKEVSNKMMEWFNEPLRDWDITRDAPYFGIQIPGLKDKYFYVWVDAPMGYISGTLEMCQKLNLNFDDFWKNPNSEIELYHLIGKDITY
ncbi:MAG TPA: class I tRNA ligase family protein, partial [Pseudobdellovibrionaceae bacterium]|nr:class I tRNA ligase family protein [Pseudobdellovibrionaceae bacterium]